MTILGLLVALILICLVIWGARTILTAFGVGEPLHSVIWVLVVIVAVLIVLGYVGAPIPRLR
jgi:hypothetical protein